jgi:hypothetical protein
LERKLDSLARNVEVFDRQVRAGRSAIVYDSSTCGATDTEVWVYNEVTPIREGKNEPFHQLNRELAGMNCFLDVVVFYVGDYPNIARILAERITGVFAFLRTFECLLAGICLGTLIASRLKTYSPACRPNALELRGSAE